MSQFKIGDKVRCINNKPLVHARTAPPLKLGGIYIVQGISTCHCGSVTLDVGLTSQQKSVVCSSCRTVYLSNDYWPCAARRFVKEVEHKEVQYITVAMDVKIKEPSLN
jgi:hypothetical protein